MTISPHAVIAHLRADQDTLRQPMPAVWSPETSARSIRAPHPTPTRARSRISSSEGDHGRSQETQGIAVAVDVGPQVALQMPFVLMRDPSMVAATRL
jgi:hypothetical protein